MLLANKWVVLQEGGGGGVRVIVFWRSKKKMANYRGRAFKGWKGKNYALSLLASFAKNSLFVFVFKHLI